MVNVLLGVTDAATAPQVRELAEALQAKPLCAQVKVIAAHAEHIQIFEPLDIVDDDREWYQWQKVGCAQQNCMASVMQAALRARCARPRMPREQAVMVLPWLRKLCDVPPSQRTSEAPAARAGGR
jgi:hypothetical protein